VSDLGQRPSSAPGSALAPDGPTPFAPRLRRLLKKRRIHLAGALSVLFHLGLILALLSAHVAPITRAEPEPIVVELVNVRPLAAPIEKPAPPNPTPVKPPPPRNIFRKTPAPPRDVPVQAAGKGPTAEGTDELSESQIASAATAGGGAPGGSCDMVGWLQRALRKDAMVQNAVAEAHRGKALIVWNGDWVRHGDQDGAGLAAVREAIMWEVAFAPVACRAKPVRGLVMISLNDGPGAARIVVGAGNWHWSDLLLSRSAASGDALPAE
jgi:hypothetical protein